MLLAVLYSLVRLLLDALVQGRKTDDALRIEVRPPSPALRP
jgi:hypothetical protein